ncbi:MAG: hypothetical protein PW788_02165 [Micavibrio sp.]|nr:hypothetical protein [Micavibrio sp.]
MTKLPKHMLDFIRSAAPDGTRTPLDELQDRFAEKKADERRLGSTMFGAPLPNPHTHGAEYLVELRIREWMMREQREHDEAKRAANAHKPAEPPQSPPRNGNKITPPAL